MKIEIQDRGIMLPDYFSGTSGVMLPLSLDNRTTVKEIIDSLEMEINSLWDHIEFVAENHEFDGNLSESIDFELVKIKEENKHRMDEIHAPTLDFCFSADDDLCFLEYPVLILTIEFLED
jgi:septation ring formation regulator EzrA